MTNRVREYRKAAGINIPELSERTGISVGHISDIELGKKEPGVRLAGKIANALETSIEVLFPLEIGVSA